MNNDISILGQIQYLSYKKQFIPENIILDKRMPSKRQSMQPYKRQNKNTFHYSTLVCKEILIKILLNAMNQIPSSQRILKYSGYLIKKTTQKIVDVNILESQLIEDIDQMDGNYQYTQGNNQVQECDFYYYKQKNQQQSILQSDLSFNNFQVDTNIANHQNSHKADLTVAKTNNQSDSRTNNLSDSRANNLSGSRTNNLFGSRTNNLTGSRTNNLTKRKMNQDHDIMMKTEGIKFYKRSQFPNLISCNKNNLFDKACYDSKITTTCRLLTRTNLLKSRNKLNQANDKSSIELANKPNIKVDQQKKPLKKQSQPQQTSPFINLRQYYIQKQGLPIQKGIKRRTTIKPPTIFQSFTSSKNQSDLLKDNQLNLPSWLQEKPYEDQDDLMIHKLRERKEKFARTGGLIEVIQTKKIVDKHNTKNNQQANAGALTAFDYTGEIFPTVKFDSFKFQPHYQEIDFLIQQSNQLNKRQRSGHMFKKPLNLKLFDQNYLCQQPIKYQALLQKPGMIMQQPISHKLKYGVEIKSKEFNQATPREKEQVQIKVKKELFQFMYDQTIEPTQVKFKDYVMFKTSGGQMTTKSLHQAKNNGTKIKLAQILQNDLNQNLSKFTLLKNKQFLGQQSKSNKVYRSENTRALQLLMTTNNPSQSQSRNIINTITCQKQNNNSTIKSFHISKKSIGSKIGTIKQEIKKQSKLMKKVRITQN